MRIYINYFTYFLADPLFNKSRWIFIQSAIVLSYLDRILLVFVAATLSLGMTKFKITFLGYSSWKCDHGIDLIKRCYILC